MIAHIEASLDIRPSGVAALARGPASSFSAILSFGPDSFSAALVEMVSSRPAGHGPFHATFSFLVPGAALLRASPGAEFTLTIPTEGVVASGVVVHRFEVPD